MREKNMERKAHQSGTPPTGFPFGNPSAMAKRGPAGPLLGSPPGDARLIVLSDDKQHAAPTPALIYAGRACRRAVHLSARGRFQKEGTHGNVSPPFVRLCLLSPHSESSLPIGETFFMKYIIRPMRRHYSTKKTLRRDEGIAPCGRIVRTTSVLRREQAPALR